MFYTRQVETHLQPDPVVCDDFADFAEVEIKKFVSWVDTNTKELKSHLQTVDEFLQSHSSAWGAGKVAKYRRIIDRQMADETSAPWKVEFEAMMKSGEEFYEDVEVLDGFVESSKSRARLVWVPCDDLTGVLTYMQHIVMKALTMYYPGFC
jgi:hypothetical protein